MAVPCSPFQLAASIARNVSKARSTSGAALSLMISALLMAESLFQSWRSFLRVEPDCLSPASREA
jgi:hypothetical protein